MSYCKTMSYCKCAFCRAFYDYGPGYFNVKPVASNAAYREAEQAHVTAQYLQDTCNLSKARLMREGLWPSAQFFSELEACAKKLASDMVGKPYDAKVKKDVEDQLNADLYRLSVYTEGPRSVFVSRFDLNRWRIVTHWLPTSRTLQISLVDPNGVIQPFEQRPLIAKVELTK